MQGKSSAGVGGGRSDESVTEANIWQQLGAGVRAGDKERGVA